MKKQILTSLVALSVLTTGGYAYNNTSCQNKGHHKMYAKKMQMHGSMKFMQMFKRLNLNNDQKMQIREIIAKSMQKKESMFSAFSQDSFDKEKFIKQASQKRENMIKLRADTLEKAYNVLTKKQKSQLRVLMDLQEERGNNFDKHCNGRR